MSTGAAKLLFEGFLKKRKDTMKMKWATYWFRLQNTTLFFYTKKDASALHLRSLYYIYTVQSVREVLGDGEKHFMFEIIMTNGKRKVLAAATAALRREWMAHLWSAMHLSNHVGLSSMRLEGCEQRGRGHSSTCSPSDGSSVTGALGGRPLSAPDTPVRPDTPVHPDTSVQDSCENTVSSLSFPEDLNSEEAVYQNTISPCGSHNGVCESSQDGDYDILPSRNSGSHNGVCESSQDGDYDILPIRNTVYQVNQSSEEPVQEEGVYDVPLSTSTAKQEYREMTESIYDVPGCSLLRKMTEHAIGEYDLAPEPHPGGERPEEGGLLADMMASLGGESARWGITTAVDSSGTYSSIYF